MKVRDTERQRDTERHRETQGERQREILTYRPTYIEGETDRQT